MSGTNDNRVAFQKMIKDSAGKSFDAVICYKIDRFARNKYDSVMYKSILKKNNVKIFYSSENIPDGPEGIILESLLEGMAEFYSAELSQKIRRGMYESATTCQATGGYLALGYKIAPDKSFEIDPDTAPIVQKIYDMYASGNNVTEICNELNSLGLKTSRGVAFNKNSLRTILKNKKYIGVYTCKDIEIEGGVPAIVSKELFDRVQERIEATKRAPARFKGEINYSLSGKLYCGKCGAGMKGESGTGKLGVKHHYYICTKKKREKLCDKKTVRKDWLERLVVDETARHILNPEKIKEIAKRCVDIQSKDTRQNDELNYLNRKMVETKKSISNLMKAIEQGIITKTTKERLSELEQIEQQLEYDISMCKIKEPSLTEKQILFMLSQFEDYDPNDTNYYSRIIDCFVNSVHLYDDRLIVTYNLTNKKTELESSVLEFLSDTTNPNCTGVSVGSSLNHSGGGGGN